MSLCGRKTDLREKVEPPERLQDVLPALGRFALVRSAQHLADIACLRMHVARYVDDREGLEIE